MNLNLEGKTALVCGASRGIGKASAKELAKLGASLVLLARNAEELGNVASSLPRNKGQHHSWITADFNNREELRVQIGLLLEKTRVHILVNNSGGPPAGPISAASEEDLLHAFGQHVLASQLLVSELIEGMKQDGYGRIINVISTSVKQPIPGLGVSNTIRGAMGNWSKTLAREVASCGITVNNVLPGATATDRLQEIIDGKAAKSGQSAGEVEAAMKAVIPMGRFAQPAELGQVVAFLASPAASYITGTNVVVDGGRTGCL